MKLSKVIVFGPIRSGKTLIGRAINAHPRARVQQEPFFFYFKICRNIYRRNVLEGEYDYDQPIETDFCAASELKEGFNSHFKSLEFGNADIAELKKRTTWQQESSNGDRAPKIIPFLGSLKPGNAVDVLRQLYNILLKGYPKDDLRYIGFTEAWVDNFIAPILSIEGMTHKIIHCIRDPRQIIASRNFGKNLEKYGGKYPMFFLIRHWRKSVAYSIINRDNPDYMVVKYEDIINSPREWFEKICGHLELPFHENIMHPERYENGLGEPWKQNTNFNAGKGFSKASLNNWIKVLPAKDLGIIEYLCGEEMDYFGYEKVNDGFGLKGLASYTEDEESIIEWLKKYRLTVNEKDISLEVVRKYCLENFDFVSDRMLDYFFVNKKVFHALAKATATTETVK